MKKNAVWLLLAALLLALAVGCAGAEDEEQGLQLWFPTDPGQERLSAALDSCPYQGDSPSIPALLSALLAGPPPDETGLAAAIPAGTRVLSWLNFR